MSQFLGRLLGSIWQEYFLNFERGQKFLESDDMEYEHSNAQQVFVLSTSKKEREKLYKCKNILFYWRHKARIFVVAGDSPLDRFRYAIDN